MQINKYLYVLLLMVVIPVSLFSQPHITPLKVGDKVPDIVMGKILNYKTRTVRFSDFKGQLLILDFWATWCGPCVAFMPEAQKLQKEFGSKVAIIPVNSMRSRKDENEAVVQNFLNKRKDLSLPSIVEDTVLRKFFPFSSIPHEVWIDGNGVVLAITAHVDVNANNIRAALAGKEMNLVYGAKDKNDATRFSNEPPPLLANNLSQQDFIFQSLLTPYRKDEQIKSGIDKKTIPGKIRMYFRNVPVGYLYQYAFRDHTTLPIYPTKQLVAEVKGADMFNDWDNPQYMYCYEVVIPAADSAHLYSIMQMDLNRYFHLNAGIENRKVKAFSLVRTTTKDHLKTKGKPTDPVLKQQQAIEKKVMILENTTITDLVRILNLSTGPFFFTDQTDYTGKIDIQISNLAIGQLGIKEQPNQLEPLRKELSNYGLGLKASEKYVDCLVIKDKVASN